MPALNWDKIVRITLKYTIGGNRLSSVMHYSGDHPLTFQELYTLLQEFGTNVLDVWKELVTEEVLFEEVVAHAVKPNTSPPARLFWDANTGAVADQSIPSNIAAVVQLRQTEISGRHNGRVFVSGIPETFCLDGLITTTVAAAEATDLANALKLQLNNGTALYTPCVLQRFDGGVAIEPQGWQVTEATPMRNLATQRRRTTERRGYTA